MKLETKLTGKRVLIVEDNPRYMANAYIASEMCGINASYAATSDQALNLLETEKFDAVVTDLMIPQKGYFTDFGLNDIPSIWKEMERSYPEIPLKNRFVEVIADGLNPPESSIDPELKQSYDNNLPIIKHITSWWHGEQNEGYKELENAAGNARGVYVIKKSKENGIPCIPISKLSHGVGVLVPLIAQSYAPNLYNKIRDNQGLKLMSDDNKSSYPENSRDNFNKFFNRFRNLAHENKGIFNLFQWELKGPFGEGEIDWFNKYFGYKDYSMADERDSSMPLRFKNSDVLIAGPTKSIYAYYSAFEHLAGNMDYITKEPVK